MALSALMDLSGPDQPRLLPVGTGALLSSVWDLQAWHEPRCWGAGLQFSCSSALPWTSLICGLTFWIDFGHVLSLWTCLSSTWSDSDLWIYFLLDLGPVSSPQTHLRIWAVGSAWSPPPALPCSQCAGSVRLAPSGEAPVCWLWCGSCPIGSHQPFHSPVCNCSLEAV